MNKLLLERIIDNKEILEELLVIDNERMGTNITVNVLLQKLLFASKKYNIENQNSILIIYDGNPCITYQLLNSFTSVNNIILYPNYSYLGINSLLVNLYDNNKCFLSKDRNYNKYLNSQMIFEQVYVVGNIEMYELIKRDFTNAIFIEE